MARRGRTTDEVVRDGLTRRRGTLGTLGSIISALGGTRQAADATGLSARQVRRLRQQEREGKTSAGAGAERLRAQATAAPARSAAMNGRREARMRTSGARVRARGTMGVRSGRSEDVRDGRTIGWGQGIELSGDQMAAILDAYRVGDDEGAMAALQDALGDEWVPGWQIDDLDHLEFLRR